MRFGLLGVQRPQPAVSKERFKMYPDIKEGSHTPRSERSPTDSLSTREWADILLAIEHAGSMLQATKDDAFGMMSRMEVLARNALEDVQRTKDEAETALAAQRAAEARAKRADACAQEAEARANRAEQRATEAERMLTRVRDALWQHILASEKVTEEKARSSAA